MLCFVVAYTEAASQYSYLPPEKESPKVPEEPPVVFKAPKPDEYFSVPTNNYKYPSCDHCNDDETF